MPDSINENGIILKDANELVADLRNGFQDIYGEDINLDSNSPDGQLLNIFVQNAIDVREVALEVYNSFDPDKCVGVIQDSRYAINNITRNGGTFTIQPIDITIETTLTLQGLDGDYDDPEASSYAVKDDSGNVFYLIDTITLTPGTYTLPFRSAQLGQVEPVIGTITNQQEVVIGVVSVNNSTAPTSIGIDQETDFAFRIRRSRSTAIKSKGNQDTILAQILDLETVTNATIWVNITDSIDSNGVPPHFIWLIVEGGASNDIAQILYANGDGCGYVGNVEVTVFSDAGQPFNVKFDRPTAVNLYIKYDFKVTNTASVQDYDGQKSYIAENFNSSLGADIDTATITNLVMEAVSANGGGGVPLNVKVSTDNTTWLDYIEAPSLASKFVTSPEYITITGI